MQAAGAEIVDKKALAEHLGGARPRLDRRLKSDRHFPVISRGDQSGGWKFDRKAVDEYLEGAPDEDAEPAPPAKAIDPAQLRDAMAPPKPNGKRQAIPPSKKITPAGEAAALQVVEALKKAPAEKPARRSAYHTGEASARQRKDEADAALKEDKLRELRGELLQKSEVRQALTTLMLTIGHDLDALPEKIVRACELPEDAAPGIRTLIDEIRTGMVKNAARLLAQNTQGEST